MGRLLIPAWMLWDFNLEMGLQWKCTLRTTMQYRDKSIVYFVYNYYTSNAGQLQNVCPILSLPYSL